MIRNLFIEGEKLYLRAVELDDAPLIAACNNEPKVRRSFFTHTPVSIERQREIIAGFYKPGADYIPLAVCRKSDNCALGMTAYHRVDLVSRAAVYSICLADTEAWGKGYATETTRLMLYYGFEILNLHRVQLHVWEGNAAGIRCYERAGFQREGLLREAMKHNGEYCSFLVMGILEDEWRAGQHRAKP